MKQLSTHFDPIGHKQKVDERNLVYDDLTQHYVHIPPDDGEPVTFKWHFSRGLLDKRMSGYELSAFVLNHMSAIIGMGLMDGNPRVKREFETLFIKLAISPKEVLDRVLSWIRVEWHKEDSDIIYMSLFDKTPQEQTKMYSISE